MFATALFVYLIATTGLSFNVAILVATVVVDLAALGTFSNIFEAWATGTTSDQEFWKDDN